MDKTQENSLKRARGDAEPVAAPKDEPKAAAPKTTTRKTAKKT